MPPLRERKEDIPLLVRAFLRHFSKANEKPLLDVTADAMNTLLAYDWPGNVRELRTAIEHGVVMATGAKVTLRDLPAAVRRAAPAAGVRLRAFDEKRQPTRSARDGKAPHHAGPGGDERQHHRGGEKARHQPPHPAPQNQ
jgi:DNA-binding NtrC family response regulator